MKDVKENWAVVTGATSGIGLEFAKQLALQRYPLLLVARRKKRLHFIQRKLCERLGIPVETIAADLSTEEGRGLLKKWLEAHTVDIFINNAGFGLAGAFSETDLRREQEMIDVNVYAMHTLMKIALTEMRRRGEGMILNVASSAGLFPGGPYMAAYYATKAYVASLTQAVSEELRLEGSRIYVGALCPGPVDTEFNKVAEVQFALKGITAKACVRTALKGMKRRKTLIVPTLTLKGAVLAGRLLPKKQAVKLVAKQQVKKIQDQ